MPIDRDIMILVVDDQVAMRKLLKQCLQALGFRHIREAADGAEALQEFQVNPTIHLVISDLLMEPMGGHQFLKAVRNSYGDVPFIMVTASGAQHDIYQARDAGVDHYLIKPFTVAAIKSRIENVFGDKIEQP